MRGLDCREAARRAEIVTAARLLFGRHGFAKVSLRDIAGEIHMSVGNLTYYYPRKTDLIEAVFSDFCQNVLPRGRPPVDLEELGVLLEQYERVLEDNAFYFRACGPLGDRLESLQVHAVQELRTLWETILGNLLETGLLEPPAYPGQYQAVSTAVQLVFRHWASFARTEAAAGGAPSFQRCIWAILYPNLTEKGRRAAGRRGYGKKQAI